MLAGILASQLLGCCWPLSTPYLPLIDAGAAEEGWKRVDVLSRREALPVLRLPHRFLVKVLLSCARDAASRVSRCLAVQGSWP